MIKKAIIPSAGRGTRMQPITNVMAKEMLPIGSIPTMELIVREAVNSGIEEILFIINRDKGMVAKYFAGTDRPLTWEQGGRYTFECLGKLVTICFAYQGEQYGSGAAILCGEQFAEGQTVAILFGDDIIVGSPTATRQLMDVSEAHNDCSVIGVQSMPEHILRTCALVVGDAETDRNGKVSVIIEKPQGELQGDLTSLGRFVLDQRGFEILRSTPIRKGELWLTDALNTQAQEGSVQYCKFEGKRYDIGNKYGYIYAFGCLAVDDETKDAYQAYIDSLRR